VIRTGGLNGEAQRAEKKHGLLRNSEGNKVTESVSAKGGPPKLGWSPAVRSIEKSSTRGRKRGGGNRVAYSQ